MKKLRIEYRDKSQMAARIFLDGEEVLDVTKYELHHDAYQFAEIVLRMRVEVEYIGPRKADD